MARILKDNTEGRSRSEPARRPAAPAATRAVDEVSWGPWRANPEPAQNEGAEAGDLPQALGERIAELLAAAGDVGRAGSGCERKTRPPRFSARPRRAPNGSSPISRASRSACAPRSPHRLSRHARQPTSTSPSSAAAPARSSPSSAGGQDRQAEALIAAAQDQARALSAAAEREARRLDDENRRAIEAAAADVQYLKRVRDDAAAAMLGFSAALARRPSGSRPR